MRILKSFLAIALGVCLSWGSAAKQPEITAEAFLICNKERGYEIYFRLKNNKDFPITLSNMALPWSLSLLALETELTDSSSKRIPQVGLIADDWNATTIERHQTITGRVWLSKIYNEKSLEEALSKGDVTFTWSYSPVVGNKLVSKSKGVLILPGKEGYVECRN